MVENTRFWRQMDIVPPEKLEFPITVVGAGAIGSATVVTLAKMGCSKITVWDNDILEEHNISNQLCKPSMVGQSKVIALAELTKELTDVQIAMEQRQYRGQRIQGVVVAAVDSMASRQAIWTRVKLNPKVPLLIDARMGAEFLRMYCIRPSNIDDIEFYEANLYGSEETEELPCSARSIIYCPTIAAGMIGSQVKSHALGQKCAGEILFDIPSMQLNIPC